jgi:lipid A 3-O-deacylase
MVLDDLSGQEIPLFPQGHRYGHERTLMSLARNLIYSLPAIPAGIGHSSVVAVISVSCFFWLTMTATANDILTVGVQEIDISGGPVFPLRLTPAQSSKLFGEQATVSWAMTISEPIGKGIFDGALSLGAEAVLLRTRQPSESYNVGAMPRLRYVFGSRALVRPYLEGGGGGMWGTLAGTPEQAGNVNFLLMAGAGVSWFFSPHMAVSVGYRFYHISNAGLRDPNSGLNYNYPFIGLSYLHY